MSQNDQRSLWFDTPITDGDVLAAFRNEREWLSRAQIAQRIQRKKTPTLTARVENLVLAGYIERDAVQRPNGVAMFIYRRVVPLG